MRKAVRIAGGAIDIVGGVPPGAKLGDVGDTERDGTSSTEKTYTGCVLRRHDPRPCRQPVAVVQPAHPDPLLGAEGDSQERLLLCQLGQSLSISFEVGNQSITTSCLLKSFLKCLRLCTFVSNVIAES